MVSSASDSDYIEDENIEGLIRALEEDPDSEVLAKSARALGVIHADEAVVELVNALSDENAEVRGHVALALGAIGDPISVPYLVEALEDPDIYVRIYSSISLGKMNDERAIPILIKALEDDDRDIQLDVMDALIDLGESSVEPLIKNLKNKKKNARANSAEILGKIGDKRSQKNLIAVLQGRFSRDHENLVRGKAAEALGNMGDIYAMRALERASEDKNKYVQKKALESLEKLKTPIEKSSVWYYEDEEISFDFQNTWEIVGTIDPKKVVKGQYDNNTITLSINRVSNVSNISIQEFAEMLMQVFTIQEIELINEMKFSQDLTDGYMLYGQDNNIPPTYILIFAFKKDDLLYYMWFAGDPEALDEAEENIFMMVESFNIKI